MLRRISKRFRVRAAFFFVALYGFCLLIPPAALALGASAAICESHAIASTHVHAETHVHADGAVHAHGKAADLDDLAGTADPKGHPQNCCGLACLSAIAPVMPAELVDQARFASLVASIADRVHGRAPDRLYRPPISL